MLNPPAPTDASLAAVTGETNTRAVVGVDLVDAAANAANETLSITVGDSTFTYTSDNTPANTAAEVTAAVAALNDDAQAQGISDIVFEVDAPRTPRSTW